MKSHPEHPQKEFAKMLGAACVRRGYLEQLHAGTAPITLIGDYSDVKVIDATGKEIPWNQVSRISQDEMKTLMVGVVDRLYTFLRRTLFCAGEDKEFARAIEKPAAPWTNHWNEPQYLPDFLMPPSPKQE
jgi:hypothetical protein